MTADNHRKEEKSEANTEELRECLIPLPDSVMAVEAERNNSFLPSSP